MLREEVKNNHAKEADEPWHKRRGGKRVYRVGCLHQGAKGWPVSYSIHIKEARNVCEVSEQSAGI